MASIGFSACITEYTAPEKHTKTANMVIASAFSNIPCEFLVLRSLCDMQHKGYYPTWASNAAEPIECRVWNRAKLLSVLAKS